MQCHAQFTWLFSSIGINIRRSFTERHPGNAGKLRVEQFGTSSGDQLCKGNLGYSFILFIQQARC
jgi:hypothetical protein